MKNHLQMIEQMEKDNKWLKERYMDIQGKYGNQFVAVYNGSIIANSKHIKELMEILDEKDVDKSNVLVEFVPKENTAVIY